MTDRDQLLMVLDSLSTMASPERWKQVREPLKKLLEKLDGEIVALRAEVVRLTNLVEHTKGVNPDIFHAHLDVCERCRKEPFNLCEEGAKALRKAAGAG